MTPASQPIFDTDEQRFEQDVLRRSAQVPVLVDFWADWCAPCRTLTPVLERLAARKDAPFVLAKVEVDDNMRLAGRYQLRGFPTVILFQHGEERGRFAGFKAADAVRELVAEWIAKTDD